MDNAFCDCFAQCWLCNRAALSLRNKEPKMTPVHSGQSRQLEKCHIHFLDSQTPELVAVIRFLMHSAGKLMAVFFHHRCHHASHWGISASCMVPYCCLLTQHYVLIAEGECLSSEWRQASFCSLTYQECWSTLTLSFFCWLCAVFQPVSLIQSIKEFAVHKSWVHTSQIIAISIDIE